MQPFIAGSMVGLILGEVCGSRVLRATHGLSWGRPGKAEVWITGTLFILCLPGIFSSPVPLVSDPALMSLANGLGCLGLLLLPPGREATRLALAIRFMHVFAAVLLLMTAARAGYPHLVGAWAALMRQYCVRRQMRK